MERKYSPILKGKRGELTAYNRLSQRAADRTFATIEIPPIPSIFKEDEPGKRVGLKHSVEEHLESFSNLIAAKIKPGIEFGVDFSPLRRSAVRRSKLIDLLIDPMRKAGFSPIPVIGLNDEIPYFGNLVDFANKTRSPFVVRVSRSECNFPNAILRQVGELSQTIGVPFSSIRLLFDFGAITPGEVEEIQTVSLELEGELPLSEFAMSSIVATSIPASQILLLGLNRFGDSDSMPRVEWQAWRQAGLSQLGFGDYGITHPDDYADIDFRLITLGGKVRYTTRDQFVVLKGRKLKGNSKQFDELAKLLKATGVCSAPNYSWGDKQIAKCASETRGPGSLEMWIAFSTNHHMTLVARQLASAA